MRKKKEKKTPKQDKAFDKATPSLGEGNPDSAPASPDLDIGIDLEPESWAKNKEKKSSDHNEILERTDYSKNF